VAYNNLINRGKVQALIPEDVASGIIDGAVQESAALALFPRVPMSTNQTRMPVLSALPTAYFVSGDTGLKQTTEMAWSNKYLNVEEIAAIVPIPEAVLADASFDIWGAVRPRLVEAIGRAVDAAIFFGVNKPASWPTDIVTAAIAAGNGYTRGTATAATGGLAEDINQLMGLLETDGYFVNGFVSRTSMRARLRSARDTTGQRLLDVGTDTIEGQTVKFAMTGLWPALTTGNAELIAGDWSQAIIGVRQDLSWKVLDQAVIQDNTGTIIYNLPQQDMVALRVTFRMAWQVPNPINYEQLTEASRFPFAILRVP